MGSISRGPRSPRTHFLLIFDGSTVCAVRLLCSSAVSSAPPALQPEDAREATFAASSTVAHFAVLFADTPRYSGVPQGRHACGQLGSLSCCSASCPLARSSFEQASRRNFSKTLFLAKRSRGHFSSDGT